jgi:hypothetical protein
MLTLWLTFNISYWLWGTRARFKKDHIWTVLNSLLHICNRYNISSAVCDDYFLWLYHILLLNMLLEKWRNKTGNVKYLMYCDYRYLSTFVISGCICKWACRPSHNVTLFLLYSLCQPGAMHSFINSYYSISSAGPIFGSGAHAASYQMGTRGSLPVGKLARAWSWPRTSN